MSTWKYLVQVAVTLVRAIFSTRSLLQDTESVQKLFQIIVPVIRDEVPVGGGSLTGGGGEDKGLGGGLGEDEEEEGGGHPSRRRSTSAGGGEETGPAGDDADDVTASKENSSATSEEEQLLIARLVHVMVNPDTDTQFKFLSLARQYLQEGGKERIHYTLPPLVFAALKLVWQVRQVREKRHAKCNRRTGWMFLLY